MFPRSLHTLTLQYGPVSPRLDELLGEKFANHFSNNSDFDIFDIIEIQNQIWIDGHIHL